MQHSIGRTTSIITEPLSANKLSVTDTTESVEFSESYEETINIKTQFNETSTPLKFQKIKKLINSDLAMNRSLTKVGDIATQFEQSKLSSDIKNRATLG